ncbi:hypothetical protein LEP1GSC103_2674 [Leptospira borgpetersenii serovar Javanica str. UI 09931]|uniref:Uncharacterized protein n=2 Tax=Leptospira borgpetersenii TaxID=174 RepID=A0AAV3JBQ9_LEPBO|nr:hypothetical protein LEP1GSC101_3019 [Leptospira borgpetersenii str. UI 09149]EMN13756.1 hypothetical protein LEP1GSC055_3855 [Leptospira borgpetersenii str. Brem 307]EMN17741.1 hypothetical protein LEP1GSC056_2924 [Leptospira borgpetersenii str. Brem 328]EMN59464.1 hypothetical protein LEP1GSC090_1582 [Leptospira borgpetersenii serovar Javanica str. MK146]EPG58176.1 hypothetical protein LEP1GSC103_2674 [Leptospira borgpetersenii serovar Javanica str. UI 09931]
MKILKDYIKSLNYKQTRNYLKNIVSLFKTPIQIILRYF